MYVYIWNSDVQRFRDSKKCNIINNIRYLTNAIQILDTRNKSVITVYVVSFITRLKFLSAHCRINKYLMWHGIKKSEHLYIYVYVCIYDMHDKNVCTNLVKRRGTYCNFMINLCSRYAIFTYIKRLHVVSRISTREGSYYEKCNNDSFYRRVLLTMFYFLENSINILICLLYNIWLRLVL